MFVRSHDSLFLRTTGPIAMVLLGVAIVTTAGCRGCDSPPTEQQKKEQDADAKKKKEKPPLEIGSLQTLFERNTGGALSEGPAILVKPGHWMPTVQTMQANKADFVGQSSTILIDKQNQPAGLEHTRFSFQSTRPVVLAKGRAKRVNGELWVPEQTTGTRVRATLSSRDTGSHLHQASLRVVRLPSYQYYVVVLAKEVSRYGFLQVTDAVRAPWEDELGEAAEAHYRVVLADATKNLPLPENMLTWSSVAYLVWDEVDPMRLSAEQQDALVDWIYWGGRLIINGPDSLDTLRGSFLEEILPAESDGLRSIGADDLRAWSDYWGSRLGGSEIPTLAPNSPWSGIQLQPRAEARPLAGGAKLFYDRDVGLGTVVVSAIQLAQRELINWPGYDSFLNCALLRRPRRKFAEGPYGGIQVDWADFRKRRLDAYFTTGLRMFARDAGTKANMQSVESSPTDQFGAQSTQVQSKVDRPGGLAGWSEFNPVAEAARATLYEAAGVRVLGAGFVLGCLVTYLAVLVPLNWAVFYALDRVEWAWIAAPVIAVLGTVVVVRQAQLDIGFVRSQTEIGLLELQGDYPRGVLSRYTALYTSLSTTYDAIFDDLLALGAPFPVDNQPREILDSVVFEKHRETRLRGLDVSSASTKMIRSEQILALEGPLRLGKSSRGHPQVENRLGFDLQEVAVVRRRFDEKGAPIYDSCWIGPLRNGSSAVLGLAPADFAEGSLLYKAERQPSDLDTDAKQFDVDALLKLAFRFPENNDPLYAKREEHRLVAVMNEVLPGVEIAPDASQVRGKTVVVAHLQYGNLPDPQPDVNSRADLGSTQE